MITSEAVRVPLPTPFGVFDVHAFERASGHVYVAMVHGRRRRWRRRARAAPLRMPHRRRPRIAALRLRHPTATGAADDRRRAARRPGVRHRPRGTRHRPGEQAAGLRRPGRRRRHRRRQRRARAAGRFTRLHRVSRRPRRARHPVGPAAHQQPAQGRRASGPPARSSTPWCRCRRLRTTATSGT